MTRLISLFFLAASCNAWALPFGSAHGAVEKRQLGGLLDLIGASFTKGLGKFMGDPAASMSKTYRADVV
jgi:hypothetical protein